MSIVNSVYCKQSYPLGVKCIKKFFSYYDLTINGLKLKSVKFLKSNFKEHTENWIKIKQQKKSFKFEEMH